MAAADEEMRNFDPNNCSHMLEEYDWLATKEERDRNKDTTVPIITENEFQSLWRTQRPLGSGSFGVVHLQVNTVDGSLRVVKSIDTAASVQCAETAEIEKNILPMLHHRNVIQFLGEATTVDRKTVFIYIEFGAAGNIQNKIVDCIGMKSPYVKSYMIQIVRGVDYIHSQGIVHRDLKPANLVVDMFLNVKICDFGMAATYKRDGKYVRFSRKCGSRPFIAPEIFKGYYLGPPVDIWAVGIIFVNLYTGNTPWEKASISYAKYQHWAEKKTFAIPFRPDGLFLQMLRMILQEPANARPTAKEILHHPWFS